MEQLKAIAEQSGKSTSEVIQEAIANYLGKTTPDGVSSLHQRVTALEKKYQKLATLIAS
jgi:hypothetical protein